MIRHRKTLRTTLLAGVSACALLGATVAAPVAQERKVSAEAYALYLWRDTDDVTLIPGTGSPPEGSEDLVRLEARWQCREQYKQRVERGASPQPPSVWKHSLAYSMRIVESPKQRWPKKNGAGEVAPGPETQDRLSVFSRATSLSKGLNNNYS